jgi:hypothetical protein
MSLISVIDKDSSVALGDFSAILSTSSYQCHNLSRVAGEVHRGYIVLYK